MSSRALIFDRVSAVRERIGEIAGSRPVDVMAVTKYRTREEALWAVEAGVDAVGENRIQEARDKWAEEKPRVPLHAIGHVQTNKVKYGINLFDSIDSVDSDKLGDLLNQKSEQSLAVMVEVNVGGEETKSGLTPDQVLPFISAAARWDRLRISGLMTVLPALRENSVEETRRIRQHMQEMADLWRMCRSEGFPWAPLEHLSMGMTGDWEWAVEAGSTMIRLGALIFGPRPMK